jgi:hypothetical protein
LLERLSPIENGLARRLRSIAHSRDHRSDRPQIVYGQLSTRGGLPIAVKVFDGHTADPTTLKSLIDKLKSRFDTKRVVLVGDRGVITAPGSARISNLPLWIRSCTWVHYRFKPSQKTMVPCSCRCLTTEIWRRSVLPTFRMSR